MRSVAAPTQKVAAERPVATRANSAPAEAPAAVTPVAEAAAPAPSVAAEQTPAAATSSVDDGTSNGLEWGLAGGAVVLIAGLGLMAMRRRRPDSREVLVDERVNAGPLLTDHVSTPVVASAVATSAPTFRTDAPRHVAAAPATFDAREAGHGDLEAMAASAPSTANPFLTRKNRLRRAHFMLRQQDTVAYSDAPATAPAAVQDQRRPSPVYDFGGGISKRRGFRPATT